ncbi:MAG: hypothetical protein FJY85_00920 [Deltaproteobacteria bacterium]|nr:hypothetical protein [Deltaproteobacteria bacterium]
MQNPRSMTAAMVPDNLLLNDKQHPTQGRNDRKMAGETRTLHCARCGDAAGGQQMSRNDDTERTTSQQQLLKYAEDLARIYEQEKARRRTLEKVNEELRREIRARQEAEQAVRKGQEELEKKVQERTRELRRSNDLLQLEIAQRKLGEEQIKSQLREKDVLLSEIHHRVKNNLQMICSLLALQSAAVKDEKVLEALRDSQCRIRSMALVHEQLYRSGDLARIELSEYIQALIGALTQAYAEKKGSFFVMTDVDEIHLSVDSALPCGLIVNELVTNCMKHAFPDGRAGEIRVAFKRHASRGYILTVKDNGRGMPADIDYRAPVSLGLKLVARLAEFQLGGKLNVLSDRGTTITINLPDLE